MKTMHRFVTHLMASSLVALTLVCAQAQTAPQELFRDHGAPAGTASEVLPQGAIVHLQLGNLYQSLLRVEQFATNLIPSQVLPPELQPIAQAEHPLLMLAGMQLLGEPLSESKVREQFGLDPAKPVTASVFAGDPRKSFIITLGIANPKVLEDFVHSMNPETCEEITLSDHPAAHLQLQINGFPLELFVVCSANTAYICGDRNLALALHNTPADKRLSQDAFMRQALPGTANKDLALLINTTSIKPMMLQAQGLGAMVVPMIQMQRQRLISQLPPEQVSRLSTQLHQHLGVRDLNEFADYAECVLTASYQQLNENSAKGMSNFDGACFTIELGPALPQATASIYSKSYQPDQTTQSLPMAEVRKAMAWLGNGLNSFSATGRQPEIKPSLGTLAWLDKMKSAMAAKGLKTSLLDQWHEEVQNLPINQPLATKVPWVLTAKVPLNNSPDISKYQSLETYLADFSANFSLPLCRSVNVMPGKDMAALESFLKGGVSTANDGEKRARDFWKSFNGQTPWFEHTNRYQNAELKAGIRKYVQESTYTTHNGIFGNDEHELVNRRIYVARTVDGYVVYHQGARNLAWLESLPAAKGSGLSPAFEKLLSRLPADANYFHLHRALNQLPDAVNWLASLENLARTDLQNYLAAAEKIQKEAASPEAAQTALASMKMPSLVYSLNRNSSSNFYCLLPGGHVYPRPRVVELVQNLLADYSAQAAQLGGGLVYTRVRPGMYECSAIQSTEGLTCLIKSVAGKFLAQYGGSPEKLAALHQALTVEADNNIERYDEIIASNPAWAFIPRPETHHEIKTVKGIAKRAPNTPPGLLNLSKKYNASLNSNWHGGNTGMNSLRNLPSGIQEFDGVKFDVRGIVQLAGKKLYAQSPARYPKEVTGIKVKQTAQEIHFLHAAAWIVADGTPIGNYRVNYANGESKEIPIVYGQDVRDWWTQPDEAASDTLKIAWTGKNTVASQANTPVRLFKTTWKNPLPEETIASIDFRTTMSDSAPFLIAITLDKPEVAAESPETKEMETSEADAKEAKAAPAKDK